MDYYEYLDSDHWNHLRQVVLNRAAERAGGWALACEGCRSAMPTQVHHLTYERLGHERLTDLVALCRDCHQPGLYVDIRLPDTRWADDPDYAFEAMSTHTSRRSNVARITPRNGTAAFIELEDDELYEGTLVNIDWGYAAERYGGDLRMILDWQVGEDENDTVRDYIGMRLGKQQSGQVSKLRMLLNALSHRKATDEIAWFVDRDGDEDDADREPLTWSYDGEAAENKLEYGMTVGLRGSNVEKEDGSGTRFRVDKYQMLKQAKPQDGRAKPKPAAASVDPDDIPF